jgi:hypothetical protein
MDEKNKPNNNYPKHIDASIVERWVTLLDDVDFQGGIL